jgi:Tfp pilus assembly protein PilZ
LGEGGLFAVTQTALPEGSSIDVIVEAPSLWQPVVLRAVVAWVSAGHEGEHAGLGLRFASMDERQRQALGELLCALDFEA